MRGKGTSPLENDFANCSLTLAWTQEAVLDFGEEEGPRPTLSGPWATDIHRLVSDQHLLTRTENHWSTQFSSQPRCLAPVSLCDPARPQASAWGAGTRHLGFASD